MNWEYYFYIIGVLLILYILWNFIKKYIKRWKFIIKDNYLHYIKYNKDLKIDSIFNITDIFISSNTEKIPYSIGPSYTYTFYTLFLIKDKKILFRANSKDFYITEISKLRKVLKSRNIEVKYNKYNKDSFLNIFEYYRNKNIFKD